MYVGPRVKLASKGPAGAAGADGAQGPSGPPGIDGPEGPEGPQGPIGPIGPQGEQGPQGLIGPPGLDGEDGLDGPPGPVGPVGPVGPPGPPGLDGEDGLDGPPGPPGLDGARGQDGAPGLDGEEAPVGLGLPLTAPHTLLSSEHTDALAAPVEVGDIIYGNSTPRWARLARPVLAGTGIGYVLSSVGGIGSLPTWSPFNSGVRTLLSASSPLSYDNTSGQFRLEIGTQGDIITYQTGAAVPARLAIGTAGQFLRATTLAPGVQPAWATIDHGADLAGLTDDDHTQYALLAGRAASQTLIGSTGAGNVLQLQGNSADANLGTVNLLSKIDLASNVTAPGAASFNYANITSALSMTTGGGLVRALLFGGTVTWTGVNPNAARALMLFGANPTVTHTGNRTMSPADIYYTNPLLTPLDTTTTTAWGAKGLYFRPQLQDSLVTSGSAAANDVFGVQTEIPVFGRRWTVSRYGGLLVKDPAALGASSTLTEAIGVEIDDLTRATTNMSLRSVGTAVSMRHAGPARFGATGAPTASTAVDVQGRLDVTGDLRHQGTNLGFYNVGPVARPSAYTQTYSTADKTHAAALTDSTGGATDGTLAAVAGTGADATINNNFADVAANLLDLKQLVNSIIDDLQALGLVQ